MIKKMKISNTMPRIPGKPKSILRYRAASAKMIPKRTPARAPIFKKTDVVFLSVVNEAKDNPQDQIQ